MTICINAQYFPKKSHTHREKSSQGVSMANANVGKDTVHFDSHTNVYARSYGMYEVHMQVSLHALLLRNSAVQMQNTFTNQT
jgi:hypothetical protein